MGTPVTYLRGDAALTYNIAPAIVDYAGYAEHTDIWAAAGGQIIAAPLLEGAGVAVVTAYGGNASVYLDGALAGSVVGNVGAGGTLSVPIPAGVHTLELRAPVDVPQSFAFAKLVYTPTVDPVPGIRIVLRQSITADNSIAPAIPVLPAPALAGSLLVVSGACRSSAGPLTVTDNIGTAWTDHPAGSLVVGASDAVGMRYKLAATGGEQTVTSLWGGTNNRNRVTVSEWTIPGGGRFVLDGSAQDARTAALFSAGSLTPTAGPVLLVGVNATGAFDAGYAVAPAGSTLELDDASQAGGFHPHHWAPYRIIDAPAGAYELTGAYGAAIVSKGLLLALRALPAVPGLLPRFW